MEDTVVKLSDGGRVVIPAIYRKQLGLQIGDELIVRIIDGELRLLTRQQAVKHAQSVYGKYIPTNRSLAEELIAERREEDYRA